MPELIAFYEDHAAQRDQFVVLAIHDDSVKSFSELDKKLVEVKKNYWQGKSLPCPVLLDGKKKTHELYGVHGWPTGVLIDPEGKVVGEAVLAALASKLPPLPVQARWARHRDLQKNIFWSFEPKDNTLPHLEEVLERWTECPITLDHDAIKSAGLTLTNPLPGVVIGSGITLRSIEQLLLAPHGLGLVPSADGNSLRLTTRPPTKAPLSYFQKLHQRDLEARLDKTVPVSGQKPSKPVYLANQPLLEAMQLISHEYDFPFALDAKAMQSGQLDPQAKVSGDIDPANLRRSLDRMLTPLGLKLRIRQEVVAVVPFSR